MSKCFFFHIKCYNTHIPRSMTIEFNNSFQKHVRAFSHVLIAYIACLWHQLRIYFVVWLRKVILIADFKDISQIGWRLIKLLTSQTAYPMDLYAPDHPTAQFLLPSDLTIFSLWSFHSRFQTCITRLIAIPLAAVLSVPTCQSTANPFHSRRSLVALLSRIFFSGIGDLARLPFRCAGEK